MEVNLQLERLKRNFNDSIKRYDIVSFLDLVHSLRVWTEMYDESDVKGDKTFKVSKPPKKLMKLIKRGDFIFMHLPQSVITYAADKKYIGMREIISAPKGKKGAVACWASFGLYGDLTVDLIYTSSNYASDEEVKQLHKGTINIPTEKLSFYHYMKRPLLYFRMKDYEPSYISREQLVKRLANEYSASHAKKDNSDLDNMFSGPVRKFMDYKCAGLPLPYFAILHVANDIIQNLDVKE